METVIVYLEKNGDNNLDPKIKYEFSDYPVYSSYIYKRIINSKNMKLHIGSSLWNNIMNNHPEIKLNKFYYIQKLDEFLNIFEKYT